MTTPSAEDLGAMSPDTTAMIARARAWDDLDPAFDEAACERVLAGVESVVGPPPEGGDGGPSGAPRSLRRLTVVALIAAGLVGLGGGAMLARSAERASPGTASTTTVRLDPLPPTIGAPLGSPTTDLPAVDVTALPSAPVAVRQGATDHSSTLAAELRLTTAARAALTGGDAAKALRDLDEHSRRFPDGQLTQERESLRIQALIASGDLAAARTRAVSFRTRYPQGLLLPSVERALAPHDD